MASQATAKTGYDSAVTERAKRATVTVVTAFAQAVVGALFVSLRSRANLVVENLALRQQLAVLRRRTPRPRLGPVDRAFWVILSRL